MTQNGKEETLLTKQAAVQQKKQNKANKKKVISFVDLWEDCL